MSMNIAIGIITCMRPKGLRKLLESIAAQAVPEGYTLSAIVVDNDLTGQNRKVVEQVQRDTGLTIHFVEEPVRGIPAARNASVRAVLERGFDAMIFVDDDEIAPAGWLKALLAMWEETGADVVTGPVKGILPEGAPAWAAKSGIYDQKLNYAHGQKINVAYTNNTLVSRKVLEDIGPTFSMRFRYSGSSDLHYFSMAHAKGYEIRWCHDAIIDEDVPLSRIRFAWVLKRGFRIGSGNTVNRIMLTPGILSCLRATGYGIARMGWGALQMLLFPLGGWRYAVVGLKRIAVGAGNICGLFGVNPEEYKTIHGQ